MTQVHRAPIVHPAAWTARELGGKDGLAVRLEGAHLDAIDRLLERTRALPVHGMGRADFDDPVLNAFLAGVRETIMKGRGAVLIQGLPAQRYGPADMERIYWGFGTHLGIAAEQSARGDRMGYVEAAPDDGRRRGYRSLQELRMHTDSYEVVGLMCIRAALHGGHSSLASGLAIHNELLRTRPEVLPALYRGWRYATGEAQFSDRPITEAPIPIFTVKDGVLSCNYERLHIDAAAKLLGEPLPADLAEALAAFDALAADPGMALNFLLQPGEMLWWHNFTVLHARTAFEDAPDSKRLLLRLWLDVPDGRPGDPSLRVRADTYRHVYAQAIAQEQAKAQRAPRPGAPTSPNTPS